MSKQQEQKHPSVASTDATTPGLRLVKTEPMDRKNRFKPQSSSKFIESLNDYAERLEREIQHILSL